ncbi:hypothetical protein KR054_012265 [Drosophila jambulina]|nr:hypothetical protein KR054_012265 [Drosophila jambulina]
MDFQSMLQQMYNNAGGMPMMMPPPQNGYGYANLQQQQLQQPFCPFPVNGAVEQVEQPEEDDEDDEEQRTLYCGNLDERVSEEILYEVFLQAGPIEQVRIPTDNTGRQRNFGFVTYQHLCAVPFALQLYQGLELYQKKVTIKQQGADRARQQQKQQQQQHSPANRLRNPFMMEPPSTGSPQSPHHSRHQARHSMHGAKPYDRKPGGNNNGDQRRRSDSSVMERNRPRQQQQQHHQHLPGGSRRSDQRHNNTHNQRRLL